MHSNWIRNARLWFLWSRKTCVRLQTTALGHLQQWFSVRVAVPIVKILPQSRFTGRLCRLYKSSRRLAARSAEIGR